MGSQEELQTSLHPIQSSQLNDLLMCCQNMKPAAGLDHVSEAVDMPLKSVYLFSDFNIVSGQVGCCPLGEARGTLHSAILQVSLQELLFLRGQT